MTFVIIKEMEVYMGFRDLRSFNLAMLGKQIWRIIHYPHSLLSRVLKAKYFPECDVLEASPKSNGSFTWKSMFAAMSLVKEGLRWRIGSGEGVRIWEDNWLPRDYNLRPITPDLYELGDITVSNLLNTSLGTWDNSLIQTLF